MRGNISQGSSGAPKKGDSASLGQRITSKTKTQTNLQTKNSNSVENSQETNLQTKEQELNQYSSTLQKYQNEDPSLAFMKESNFEKQTDGTQKQNITELNAYLAGADSLASRIATATGRYSAITPGVGRGRSQLPGESGQGSSAVRKPPRNALTNSQLFLGNKFNQSQQNNIAQYGTSAANSSINSGSAVSNILSGNQSNQAVNFESYASSYLKENASYLSSKFESDPAFKAKYLANVEKLYNGLNVRTLGQAPVSESRTPLVNQAGLATARDKMQVANAFMTLLANSDQQINKVANSGLSVFLADSIVSEGERVAGYFSTANHMVLSRDPGFATFNATAVHELTHVIDHSDGSLDGYINGLSPDWTKLRDNAEQKIASTSGNLSGLESGFLNYSRTNDMEFLAVMSQLYQSDTHDFQRNFPELFNTLDRMFRVA
jgi:hypothetical protein